jgi:hypothetical protein
MAPLEVGNTAVLEHHGQIRSQGSASLENLGLSEQTWSERAARRPNAHNLPLERLTAENRFF